MWYLSYVFWFSILSDVFYLNVFFFLFVLLVYKYIVFLFIDEFVSHTSFLSCRIYCNLTHCGLEKSYGDIELNQH